MRETNDIIVHYYISNNNLRRLLTGKSPQTMVGRFGIQYIKIRGTGRCEIFENLKRFIINGIVYKMYIGIGIESHLHPFQACNLPLLKSV